MRVFIAIELDDEIKKYLSEIQTKVKKNSIKGNFTREANFHLTLRFIGDVDDKGIHSLKRAIDETSKEFQEFELKLGGLGEFPRKDKKIIWIGLSEGIKELKDLFKRLENNLEKQGFNREERGLKPHITIGREVRVDKPFEDLKNEISIEPKLINVKKISLMESTRVNGVLSYIPI